MNRAIVWLHGLTAAFITGAANSVAVVIIDPVAFNFGEQWKKTLGVAVVSGCIGAAAYLQRSPLPPLPPEAKPEGRPPDNA
jgi:hypothetical protein